MNPENRFAGFTVFQATCMGKPGNCEYPHKIRVTDADSLKLAVRRDYVCARYQNSYRSTVNFLETDCVAMDVDNDHSDEPKDWITPDDIRKVFPDVTLGVHYSRHHMKPKKGRTARPRYHVFMSCGRIEDPEVYKALKERLQRVFPYFDTIVQKKDVTEPIDHEKAEKALAIIRSGNPVASKLIDRFGLEVPEEE